MRINKKSGIPLYAAAFVDPSTFVVAGGGGQGAHGVKNLVMVYSLTGNDAVLISDFELPEDSDSPTSMAIDDKKHIWLGANIPTASNGKINHLIKFDLDDDLKLSIDAAYDLFNSRDISTYQKSTSVAGSMVAAASSADPGLIAILSTVSDDILDLKFDGELADAAMSDYDEKKQRFVAAAMADKIDIRTISNTNKKLSSIVAAPKGGKWSRIVSLRPGKFVAAAILGRAGSKLCVIDIDDESGEAKLSHSVDIPAFKGVTALTTNGSRVAVASSTGDVYVYNASFSEPTVVAQLKYVHKLPVTALALNKTGDIVVSTSLDGSLSVNTELNDVVSLKATLGWAILSAAIIMIVALAVTLVSFPMPGLEDIAPPSPEDISRSFHEFIQDQVIEVVPSVEQQVSPSIESLYVSETEASDTQTVEATVEPTVEPIVEPTPDAPVESTGDVYDGTPSLDTEDAEPVPNVDAPPETDSERIIDEL